MTIVIEVRGGLVQEVYTDEPSVTVILIDWDTQGCSEHDQGIVAVHDTHRQKYLVHAVEFPTTSLNDMPFETIAAVEAASQS